MTNELGFGIAGSGMVAKVHAEAIAAIPGARLVAIWGRDPERARALASTYSAQPFTDYNEFLNHPGLNVVNICTPNGRMPSSALPPPSDQACSRREAIEVSLNAADELINACERKGIKLGVIFQSRFLPAAVQIKNAVDEGSLGQLILGDAYVKWYRSPEYYADSWHGTRALDGGGALINQAIHTADLLRWIMGPAETVFAFRSSLRYPQLEGEDTLVANIRFANVAFGVIEAPT
jgi:predicted dehydrogenase